MTGAFARLTTGCARFTGRPAMLAICVVLSLAGVAAYLTGDEILISGANLTISILTLLLLPILQATQSRDGEALQAKLDELIKVTAAARDSLIGLEKRSPAEIERMRPS